MAGYAELTNVRMWYDEHGKGEPLVLIHGGVVDSRFFVHNLGALTDHFRVYAIDLRGHGRSDAGRAQFSIQSWAEDVEALITALELPAVTLVGHSMGTLITQHLAATKPEIVDNLVLVGGISYFEPPVKDLYAKRAEIAEADGMDALVDDWLPGALSPRTRARLPQLEGLVRDLFLRNDARHYAKSCRALAKAPSIRREDIGQPTLLIVGDHDRSTPIAMTEELHREIPVSRIRVVPGAAHWVPLEDPDMISAAILEFLT
jgi:3-oxoadipate enol-lactonase